MKSILNKYIPFLLAFSMTVIITMFTSCDNDDDVSSSAPPVITEIRNYAASPNDTLVDKIVPGQWIVIHGKNLKDAKQISFNGGTASFEHGLFSDNTAVLQVPWSVPLHNVDPALLHTINYGTKGGTTTFKFNVVGGPATITGTSMTSATMVGDSLFIYGTNLYLIEKLTIEGVDVSSLTTVSNGSSIGFVLPAIDAPIPWEGKVVAASGIYEFDVLIVPEIFAVSNANPSQGDSVRIYGKNLNGVSSFKFGGATITDFTEDPEGSYVEFLAPDTWSYDSGRVIIVSDYGTAKTVYHINTQNKHWLGLLANFEWGDYFGYDWSGDISLNSNMAVFNGSMGTNTSQYVYFDTPILAGGESKFAQLGNANNTSINNANAWVPKANLSDPVGNWGLQFEISVAKPWNGGTLYFKTAFAGELYVARFEPWKITASKTVDFETDGWQTVTIPLSEFRSKKVTLGDGDSVTSLNRLIGPAGESKYDVTLKNFASKSTATGFYAGIDNIRVVKIK
jgi:hypothetical protein